MKKRGIQINFSNRWLYTLILVGIVLVAGVGVTALSPGVIPNPGHLITNDIAPPSGCSAGQVLSWTGSAWSCITSSSSSISGSGAATRVAFWSGASTLSSNSNLYWDNTNSRLGIGTTSPTMTLDVAGPVKLGNAVFWSSATARTTCSTACGGGLNGVKSGSGACMYAWTYPGGSLISCSTSGSNSCLCVGQRT